MEDVYIVAIIATVIVFAILIYLCSMSGYTTKRKIQMII
jgi:cell division protein FtsL